VRPFGFKSVKDLRETSDRRRRQFLREQIGPYHPHYGRVFKEHGIDVDDIRSVKDLSRIPFTMKEDLVPSKERPEPHKDFVLQPTAQLLREHAPIGRKLMLLMDRLLGGPERARSRIEQEYLPVFLTATTGRSARPVPFVYTLHDIEILKEAGRRLIDVIGVRPHAKTINLFPYAPHLAFWQVTMAGLAHGVMVIGTGGGKIMGTEGNIQLIERMSAEVLVGVPSYVYHLLRRAARSGTRLPHIRSVVLGAEKVPEGLKEKIREVLRELGSDDVAVFGTYGFTEARMAFAERPTANSSGYHLYPDLGVFEIVDPDTGEQLPDDADGELVYTPLDGRGTVVLRYRTGDLVRGGIRIENIPELGGYLPVLSSDIVRVSNIRAMDLKKVKGTLVDLNEISHLLGDMPAVEEWQVEIRKRDDDPYEVDQVHVCVALKDGMNIDRAKFSEDLAQRMMLSCEIQPNEVRIVPLDELVQSLGLETEMKEKRIVDLRPGK